MARVVATGVQPFEARFPGKRRRLDVDLPPISQWRCNLTGLSQVHNLYFIAYRRNIHVYVPRFPTQDLQHAVLVLPSQPSGPTLRGYLDPDEPHSVNNLIVQFLGSEEVVATVRDDGDVEAFLVRHIMQAIERRAESDNSLDTVADEVRPIFQSNVGISAWGLAVHTHARIIAVSSNAHKVTIFRFALLSEFEDDNTGNGVGNVHADDDPGDFIKKRRTDVTHQVLNGESNIPYISFCNTGDDPNARWLLTTDMSGICRVLDLHKLVPVQAFRFGPSFARPHSGGYDRLNAGWAIIFLDTRSFQPEESIHDSLGLEEGETLPDKQDSRVWDLSKTVTHLSDVADSLVHNKPRIRQEDVRSSSVRLSPPSPRHERDVSADSIEHGSEDSGGVSLEQDIPNTQTSTLAEDETGAATETIVEVIMDSRLGTNEADSDPEVVDNDDDLEDEGTEDTISLNAYYDGKRICGNRPQFVRQTDLCDDLPCPILHASVRNVYLLQPSNQPYHTGPFVPPLVGLAKPLQQVVQRDYRYLDMFDRLNMNAYIPSLGVVVLASQKGRALVLSLTKVPTHVHYPKGMQDLRFTTNYAMRVEAILPFAHQEKANQRPFMPLHGIAVGPMQGTEALPDERKRWRLLMMYQDHSMLSYEIGRRRNRDSAVAIENLVV